MKYVIGDQIYEGNKIVIENEQVIVDGLVEGTIYGRVKVQAIPDDGGPDDPHGG